MLRKQIVSMYRPNTCSIFYFCREKFLILPLNFISSAIHANISSSKWSYSLTSNCIVQKCLWSNTINKRLPLIEWCDRDEVLCCGTAEVSRWRESPWSLLQSPHIVIALWNRGRASASYVWRRKIGRLSNREVCQGRWIGGKRRRRVVLW